MTIHMAIQILLTIIVTGTCTLLAINFINIAKDAVKLQKWFTLTAKSLFVFHMIALPAAIINLIWSF